jgi:hypothetical protein
MVGSGEARQRAGAAEPHYELAALLLVSNECVERADADWMDVVGAASVG